MPCYLHRTSNCQSVQNKILCQGFPAKPSKNPNTDQKRTQKPRQNVQRCSRNLPPLWPQHGDPPKRTLPSRLRPRNRLQNPRLLPIPLHPAVKTKHLPPMRIRHLQTDKRNMRIPRRTRQREHLHPQKRRSSNQRLSRSRIAALSA